MAVGGVGGHLAWVCAWRDGDGVSLDLRHFAIALRLASRRPAHTGHSVDTTAFVKTTAADLCRRYSGQPAFEFVADGHHVGDREIREIRCLDFFFPFEIGSGAYPHHCRRRRGWPVGVCLPSMWDPPGLLLPGNGTRYYILGFSSPAVGFCGLKKIAISKTWRVK